MQQCGAQTFDIEGKNPPTTSLSAFKFYFLCTDHDIAVLQLTAISGSCIEEVKKKSRNSSKSRFKWLQGSSISYGGGTPR